MVVVSSSKPKIKRGLRLVRGGRRSDAPPELPDDEIIDAVLAGDPGTAGLLYDRLFRVVDGTLCRLLGRRESEHDDLVQSTFEQILVSICRGRFARRCSLASWATAIATHVALNALRTRRRRRNVIDGAREGTSIEDVATAAVSVERQVAARIDLERLRGHVAAMDPRQAEAVLLHDAFGCDLAEVAQAAGITVAAAQSRLVRGRRELHRRLAAGTAPSGRAGGQP
jgi:RNA polymerase sigma-70 factor (ECF subfamily)